MFWPRLHPRSGLGMQRKEPDTPRLWPGRPRKDQCHVPQPCWRTWPDFWQEGGGPEETIRIYNKQNVVPRHLKMQCFPLQRPLCTDAWPVLHISLCKKHPGQTWEGRNLGILVQDWRFCSQQPAVRIPPWCKKSDQTIQFQLSDWSSIITEEGWLQLRAVLGDLKEKNQCEVVELLIKLNGMPLDWSSAEPACRS